MRKLFWCGAVVAVVAAAAFYWAADYACRHPSSVFCRCVVTACQMTVDVNPIGRLGQGVMAHTRWAVRDVVAATQPGQPSKAPCCTDPSADLVRCPMVPPLPQTSGEQGCGPWDASAMAEGQMIGRVTIPGDEEIRHALNPIHDAPLEGAEEAEFVPDMSRVVDPEDGPGVMEPVKDFVELPTVEYRNGFFHGGEEVSSVEPKQDSGKQEEPCEPIEMPVIDDNYHRLDPYHYHCPQSSGCCPYSGKCPTSEPCSGGACPGKLSPATGEEISEPEDEPARLKKKARSMLTPAGCSCPTVDTLEFRKTDAQPGQFEKMPY